jgi:flagellar motor switch/type III secretory pathway protein FliN
MRFIKAEEEIELEAVAQKDPLIKKAVARLMELSADEKARLLYEKSEKERMDYETREEEARAEERYTIAQNLLKINIPVNQIITATGLSITEIEKLREVNKGIAQ